MGMAAEANHLASQWRGVREACRICSVLCEMYMSFAYHAQLKGAS